MMLEAAADLGLVQAGAGAGLLMRGRQAGGPGGMWARGPCRVV